MKKIRTIWLTAVVLFLGACPALGVLEFKDGLTHNIDYAISENVYVDLGAPYMYTTVNWLAGGSVWFLCGCEQSRINIRGGYIYILSSCDSSQINISGGSIGHLLIYDSSQVDISGGSMSSLFSSDSSQVDISGGSIGWLYSYNSSQVNISGGRIGGPLTSYDSSQVNISGGTIGDGIYVVGSSKVDISGGSINHWLSSYDSSQVNISGGLIDGWLASHDSSQVNISGGEIGDLQLGDQSKIQIFGSDFAVDGLDVGFGELTSILGGYLSNEPLRHLTGTLLSGGLINNGFRIGQNARIILIPEPASAVIMVLGATLIASKRRRQ